MSGMKKNKDQSEETDIRVSYNFACICKIYISVRFFKKKTLTDKNNNL